MSDHSDQPPPKPKSKTAKAAAAPQSVSEVKSQIVPPTVSQARSAFSQISPSQTLAQTLLQGPASAAALDLTDCMLGEFRVLRRLGSGGMAQVYLAEQTSLKRNVAIKVMRPDFNGNDVLQQRFEHEAKAAAGLNHRNIVQVYGVGDQDGVRFIAQEYVLGMNLKQYLSKKPPPSTKLAIHLLKQVCAALQCAHDAGVVHRDIKPENIMLTAKFVAKVTDFGLAQLTEGGERLNLTQAGQTMGTPLYMSPEQINDAKVDHRADLYSLGVAFFHLLAGHPPFMAATAYALASKHLNEAPPALKQFRPDLPSKLTDIIHRLMSKKPADRFPDAKSVIVELKQIEKTLVNGDDEDLTEDGPSVVPFAWLQVPPKKLLAYAIACVVVYLLAAGAGRDLRRTDPFDARSDARAPN